MYKDLKEKFAFTLGATHVGIFHNTRRVAFTLAEVLITLGIIGIVSAMTIPTLVKNYQQMLLVTRFKKEYSTLSQAYKLALLDFGPTPPRCGYYEVNGPTSGPMTYADCAIYGPLVIKRLHVVKKCMGNSLRDGCNPGYKGQDDVLREKNPDTPEEEIEQLANTLYTTEKMNDTVSMYMLKDGSTIMYSESSHYGARNFLLDINGLEGPNKWGYDLFRFRVYFKKGDPFNPVISPVNFYVEKGGMTSYTLLGKIQNNKNK